MSDHVENANDEKRKESWVVLAVSGFIAGIVTVAVGGSIWVDVLVVAIVMLGLTGLITAVRRARRRNR